jgi:hypothetical protein
LDAVICLELLAANYCLDAGIEFGQVKGLGQIVVRSALQSLYFIVEGILSRKDNGADQFVLRPKFFQEFEPVPVRQGNVQQDAIVLVEVNPLRTLLVVGGLFTSVFLPMQIFHNAVQKGNLVFDNEQFHTQGT